MNGDELLSATYLTEPRFVIDFGNRDVFEAREFAAAFEIVRERVLPDWERNAAKEKEKTGKITGEHQNRINKWWQLKRKRSAIKIKEWCRATLLHGLFPLVRAEVLQLLFTNPRQELYCKGVSAVEFSLPANSAG
jgi:hypothetical protein